ncbi:aldehyde dehydrogenase family protein [Parafrigoribacterium soli]|uniref:aldehyde dehydrogenase family protein n=1 Tax=Parafrigoribacterium soli TaxID=3144663 RepID=UPI0032EFA3D8
MTTITSDTVFAIDVGARADDSLTILDPRDDAVVGSLAMARPVDIDAAVANARAAWDAWAALSPSERASAVRGAAEALRERERELAELNQRETGRPFEQALAGIRAGVDTLMQAAAAAPHHTGALLRGAPLATDYTIPEPRGVVAVITPWNDPVAVACEAIGAALATGNTVVHKPSERCPHLGEAFGRAIADALPPHVFCTVTGDASRGELLVSDARIAVVSHVGSTRAGDAIARAVARTGAHLIRENGGNDALIVDRDVELHWAAQQAALGAFANSGQICTSVERIYALRGIAAPFTELLEAEARRLHASGELGPLVDRRMRDAVHEQVAESIAMGALLVTGGTVPQGPGAYYPPTVLTRCTSDMPVMREETFGPVAPVQLVGSFEEALDHAAADRYGLAATVLTSSMEHAQRAIRALPVGTVKINAVFGGAPGGSAQPRAASGSGFGYGPKLLDEMTTTKVVHLGLPEAVRP